MSLPCYHWAAWGACFLYCFSSFQSPPLLCPLWCPHLCFSEMISPEKLLTAFCFLEPSQDPWGSHFLFPSFWIPRAGARFVFILMHDLNKYSHMLLHELHRSSQHNQAFINMKTQEVLCVHQRQAGLSSKQQAPLIFPQVFGHLSGTKQPTKASWSLYCSKHWLDNGKFTGSRFAECIQRPKTKNYLTGAPSSWHNLFNYSVIVIITQLGLFA